MGENYSLDMIRLVVSYLNHRPPFYRCRYNRTIIAGSEQDEKELEEKGPTGGE